MKSYIYALAAILLVVVVGNSYTMYSKDRIVDDYATAYRAVAEIKQEITIAHLWVDEILGGHKHASFDDFWQAIDKVDTQVELIRQLHIRNAVDFRKLPEMVDRLKNDADTFRSIAVQIQMDVGKSVSRDDSEPGLDTGFDAVFQDIIDQCNGLDHELDLSRAQAMKPYAVINMALITLGLLGVLAVLLSLWRSWYRHVHED